MSKRKSFTEWLLEKTGIKDQVLGYVEDVLDGKSPKFNNYSTEEIKYNIKKNYTWFKGDVVDLAKFYKEYTPPNSFDGWQNSNFWAWVNKDRKVQKVHLPIAATVSQAMTSLVFSQFPKYSVVSGNKVTNKGLDKIVQDTFRENDIETLFQNGVKLESYSGAIAARFVIDPDFSSTPIIQIYPMGDFEVKEKYGRLFEIQFKDIYQLGKESYLLTSTYGKGYIKYKLYQASNMKEVPLNTLEETASLKDILVYGPDNKLVNIILAAYKVNRSCNNVFPNSILGASDYDGLDSIFDSIDAIASLRQTYFKYGSRIKRVVTEDQLEKDKDGNVIMKEDSDGLDILVLKDSNPMDTAQIRDMVIPNLSQQAYEDAIRNLIGQCCDRCGISRTAFGIESAGRNASAEALEIRENASYRTRAEKVKLWTAFIEDIMRLVLIYSAIASVPVTNGSEIKVSLPNTFDYSYSVEFPPYEPETDLQRALRVKQIESTGYITHDDAIRMYYEPILDVDAIEEKIKELGNVKKEPVPTNDENPPSEETPKTGEEGEVEEEI